MAQARRQIMGLLALLALLSACGGDAENTQQAEIVAETMASVFATTTYSVVTDAVLCPDDGRRLTVVASFIVPNEPEDAVSAVKEYWSARGDLTERVTRSRWTESAMSSSIATFTVSQDGRTAEVLAFANDCGARKIDRSTERIEPGTNE